MLYSYVAYCCRFSSQGGESGSDQTGTKWEYEEGSWSTGYGLGSPLQRVGDTQHLRLLVDKGPTTAV